MTDTRKDRYEKQVTLMLVKQQGNLMRMSCILKEFAESFC